MRWYSAVFLNLVCCCSHLSVQRSEPDWTQIPAPQRAGMIAVVDSFMRAMRSGDTLTAAKYTTSAEPVSIAWTEYLRDSRDFTTSTPYRVAGTNWITPNADTAAIVLDVGYRRLPTLCYHGTDAGDTPGFLLVRVADRWKIVDFWMPVC